MSATLLRGAIAQRRARGGRRSLLSDAGHVVGGSIDVRTTVDNDVTYARFSPTTSFLQPAPRMYVTSTETRETVNGVWFTADIPKDATITSATLTLYDSEGDTWTSGQDTFVVGAEQTDDAAHWSNHANAASRYANVGTTQAVDWSGSVNLYHPHVITLPVAMIQEIVDRAGWESGNRMAFMLYNATNTNAHNRQLFGHYTVASEYHPRLQVEYESWGHGQDPGGGEQQAFFTEDASSDFPNPERGWYIEWNPAWGPPPWGTLTIESQFIASTVYQHPPTLNMRYVHLDDYRESAIPQAFLDDLATEMAGWRNTDCKAVLRFAYNRDLDPDAPLSWVLHHINQLSPLWHEYSDVIATLQAGFVGAWGEWHTSTNDLDSDANASTIAHALIDATPADMMVQFRTPYWLQNAFGSPPAYADRFTGVGHTRAGYKNDCFRFGPTDVNTFPTQESREYIHAMGPFTTTGGETCKQWNVDYDENSDCAPSVQACEDEGWDYLHSDYDAGMHNIWNDGGCLAPISRKLGYRLVLNSVTVPETVSPGGSMAVSINMTNAGFGKMYNPRPIDLVMVGPGGPFTVRLTSDARRALPLGGETKVLEYNPQMPAGLQAGQAYALYLRLPDPSTHLQARTGSCVRLANTGGVWDSVTGRHDLNLSVTVPDPGSTTLLGVGSDSDSLSVYPKTASTTVGDWYVDPTAGSNGVGTEGDPFNSLHSAISAASANQRILVRAGTLAPSTRYEPTQENLEVWNYGSERPVISGANLGTADYAHVPIRVRGAGQHWKGFEVTGVKQPTDQGAEPWGDIAIWVDNRNGVKIEDCEVHDSPGGSVKLVNSSNCIVQDCAIWKIGDGASTHTNVADGFVTTSEGDNNVFVRCFSANAPDDGLDMWSGTGHWFIDCVSYETGKYWNGNPAGDGSGYKMGGHSNSGGGGIRGCLALNNTGMGLNNNSAQGPHDYLRNTSIGNGSTGVRADDQVGTLVEDNISLDNGSTHSGGNNPTYRNNTWNLVITDAQFADAAAHDYSLAAGSPCIDAGYAGGNLGASTIALEIAKEWLAKDLT